MTESFKVGGVEIGKGKLTIIAGPCLAESLDLCLEVGHTMAALCQRLEFQFIFKASFDKANRTSQASARGHETDKGLELLRQVKADLGVPLTTDIHLPSQALPVSQIADLIQIPAFLCRQTDLLQSAAETCTPVNVKKGQFLSPHDAQNIVEKLRAFSASGIMLTERGTSFGYNALVVDFPGLEIMRSFGVPVCFDATHSAQRPGGQGSASGGNRESIPALCRAAVAVGIDALFLEVHPNPAEAASDRETQWPLAQAEELLSSVQRLAGTSI